MAIACLLLPLAGIPANTIFTKWRFKEFDFFLPHLAWLQLIPQVAKPTEDRYTRTQII